VDVAEADFEREVLGHSFERPVVVDFWAPWCRPCLMLGPLLEAQAEARGGAFRLAKVNFDNAPGLAEAFGVDAIPAVKAFRDGRLVGEFVGLVSEPELNSFLDRLAPTEAERQAAEARRLEESDPARAEALYRQALTAEPRNDLATLGLARSLAAQGKDDEAGALLEQSAFDGELAREAERLGAVLYLRGAARGPSGGVMQGTEGRLHQGLVLAATGKYREALEELLAAGAADHRLASGPVREAMVQVFHAVGDHSDLAKEYRGKLSQLLY
jgi:putative thioredoxin